MQQHNLFLVPNAHTLLEICHRHARFFIVLCSTLSWAPPLVVSCARPEICGGLSAYEQ